VLALRERLRCASETTTLGTLGILDTLGNSFLFYLFLYFNKKRAVSNYRPIVTI
jgi:hypothetical protein